MRSARISRYSAVALFTLISLGGCGSDSGGGSGPSGNDLSDAQAWVLGDITATMLGEMSAALLHFDLSGTGVLTAVPAPPAAVQPLLAGLVASAPSAEHRQAYSALLSSVPCTPVMSNTTDSDGDGMPEDLLYTWGCSVTDTASGNSSAISGKVRVRDMVDVATGFGFRVDFDQFSFITTYGATGGTDIFTRNGSMVLDVTGSQAQVTRKMVYEFHRNGLRILREAADLKLDFDPDSTINWVGHDLPPGKFAASGTYAFSGDALGNGSGDWTLNVASFAALGYDGLCTIDPPFHTGFVKGVLVGETDVGFAVSFGGCGSYAVSPLAPAN